jgi:hypothetical protein
MTSNFLRFSLCAAAILFSATRASAVVLFSDNFNSTTNTAWTTNVAPAANAAQQQASFGYDYSEMGIPPAPGSADTLGLRLRSNIPGSAEAPVTTRPAGTLSGLSLSPTGQDFGTNYQLSFYAWANFCGAPNATGLGDNAASEGGTFNVLSVVGTTGNVPLVVGNTALASGASMDGIGVATTGDGGINSDYRVYPKSGTVVPATTPGVFASGASATAMQNTNTYYTTLFPPKTAPEVQQAISTAEYGGDVANTQAGSTQAGSFGFAWQKVEITKNNNIITWEINDTPIATYDASALTLGGNNIAIGMSDVNTSTTRHPSLVFTLFDNLQVSDIPSLGTPGDFNNDTFVDAADYTVWRDNLDNPSDAPLNGNGDATPGVGLGDYDLWKASFGGAGSASISAVPEPGTLLLTLIAGCAGLFRRRS